MPLGVMKNNYASARELVGIDAACKSSVTAPPPFCEAYSYV